MSNLAITLKTGFLKMFIIIINAMFFFCQNVCLHKIQEFKVQLLFYVDNL